MNCKKVKKILTAYISDELSKDERWEVEMHLQICPYCQREFVSLQATREMLGVWDEVDPPEELFNRFEAKLAEEALKGEHFTFHASRFMHHVSRFTFHSTRWLYASATAVCFLTAVTLGLYILLSREKNTLPGAIYDSEHRSPVTSHQATSGLAFTSQNMRRL